MALHFGEPLMSHWRLLKAAPSPSPSVRHDHPPLKPRHWQRRCALTALQKKPQPGQHWCFTMPLRWSSHRTSSWTELEGRIISCFSMAPWQRVSCPSTLSVAMHFLSASVRISRLLGVSMRQLQSGSSWASSITDPEVSANEQSETLPPFASQFKSGSVRSEEGLDALHYTSILLNDCWNTSICTMFYLFINVKGNRRTRNYLSIQQNK